jgi:hypothetical protein
METTKMAKSSPNDYGLVEVLLMPISLEARGREDDWTGCSNQAVRRKLQNRLNQRASS